MCSVADCVKSPVEACSYAVPGVAVAVAIAHIKIYATFIRVSYIVRVAYQLIPRAAGTLQAWPLVTKLDLTLPGAPSLARSVRKGGIQLRRPSWDFLDFEPY